MQPRYMPNAWPTKKTLENASGINQIASKITDCVLTGSVLRGLGEGGHSLPNLLLSGSSRIEQEQAHGTKNQSKRFSIQARTGKETHEP